ncbi:hypothetical protein DOTSEDRAFT_67722 [Dothistroma septosporum NZE10]|uniref:Glutamyl-tRNA amidotransferase complex subunit Gta3 domain-containing protein n=1 Tax=Dothistroma septosporum (strain NZE10 / CBS 128990) TaxID=675120 RepID=N1PZ15_DOTSN|nr:hypothetical protein DOTSEDRAFT_67722 [Dothistroma septosporum NZE10]
MSFRSLYKAGSSRVKVITYRGQHRALSNCTALCSQAGSNKIDVEELLATPSWSVASLLPSDQESPGALGVTSEQLHHLLRLAALAPPKDQEEEKRMLSTLSSQLHFVRDIQQVDTTAIEPLLSPRDETARGEKDAELGMEALKEALAGEEVRGKHHKRIRRRQDLVVEDREGKWDVVGSASKKVGRYFVVEGGKD